MYTKRKDNRLMPARLLTALTIIFAVVLCLSFCVKVTFAADGDIASGDWWRITSEGELIIGNGGEMTIPVRSTTSTAWPWYRYSSSITSARFDGTVHSKESTSYMFNGFSNCTSIDLSGLDTSNATYMQYMFKGCSALTNLDVGGFNTNNVTQMNSMFSSCSKLTTLNDSGWNTENVTDMSSMFYGCSALTSLDVSGWNTENVSYMNSMFSGCLALTSLEIDEWNTSKVSNMKRMFYDCKALNNLNVSDWNTSNVTSMEKMFDGCSALTGLDISEWNTGKVRYMSGMFASCIMLANLDLSGWNTDNVRDMSYMFANCTALTSVDASGWNADNVTSLSNMFAYCTNLTNLATSGWNICNVIDMSNMFFGCQNLTNLDASEWNTGNVTTMKNMFAGCTNLATLDVSGWNTDNVKDMTSMFDGCYTLTNLNASGWNTENATVMSRMFYNCHSLTSLDLSRWNTANVTSMGYMFENCEALTSLNLKNFDTSKVTNMSNMFSKSNNITSIQLGEDFSFKGNNIAVTGNQAILPTPPSNANYTGKWIRDDSAVGPFTAEELREQYGDNAATWAGTWVWQEKPTTYSITFIPAENTTGSMPIQKAKADEDVTINPCLFKRFNYHLDHWEGSDGNEYADGAVIPANTFAIGDSLTLTAVFAENDNNVNIQDGKFTLTLHGGEKATFENLPAGLAYQVYEKTPDGWVLLTQTNTAGSIEPLQTAEAYFLNKYQPGTTTATFYGTKIMDGRAAQAGEYTFELLQDETVIQVKQNGDSGFIQFDTIEYDTVGTYTYTIREVPGNNNDIDYDRHEETVTVEVTKDVDNNLHAEVSYDTDGVYFVNRTKPGTIVIRKTAEGLTDANKDALFSFRVVLENENGTLVQGGNYHWYVLDANGQIVE